MTFKNYLESKTNIIILFFVFNLIALFVNTFGIEGVIEEGDRDCVNCQTRASIHFFTDEWYSGEKKQSKFWPFSGVTRTASYFDERLGEYKITNFCGIFFNYDYSEFIAYSLLFLLTLYLFWRRSKRKNEIYDSNIKERKMNNLFWEKLILNFKENEYISNGLTIPYLVGALNIGFGLPANKNTLNQLINSLVDNATENKPFLQYCSSDEGNGINEYVIALKSKEECDRDFQNNRVFRNVQLIKTLYIADNARQFGETKEEIIENLWDKYGKVIEGHFFSWDTSKQEWHNFSQIEKNRIYNIIQ